MRSVSTHNVKPGTSAPLGATVRPGGVNFSVFSKGAVMMELLLFEHENAAQPAKIIPLNAAEHRTYHYWHVFVSGLQVGQVYAYRAHGPFAPNRGLRFDADKVLLDPYGLAVAVPGTYDRRAASLPSDNRATAMKSVVVDPHAYNWEGDLPLRRPFSETIIYELHVGGFTRHPNSGVAAAKRGTYAGLIEKIPYLKDLGVTALELLPVFQFDAQDAPNGLVNYWGYQPISFFAPHHAYSSQKNPLSVLDEFRDMVKALHRAGLELILDVVFNHTTEGGLTGPTLCYRGLANDFYYILENDKSRYADYTGCGNTLNANQPIVRRMILDSLRYWVTEMHVDGFRFDLASIVGRAAPNLNELLRQARFDWHGVTLNCPDWTEQSHSLAFTLRGPDARFLLHTILNAHWEPLRFELPSPTESWQAWRRCIDTALGSPHDICNWESAPVIGEPTYLVQPRAVVVLALALEASRSG